MDRYANVRHCNTEYFHPESIASYPGQAEISVGIADAHLRYLQRDGTTRDGERGQLYGPETDNADGRGSLNAAAISRSRWSSGTASSRQNE